MSVENCKPEFILQDVDLQSMNTMACQSVAQYFVNIESVEQLILTYKWLDNQNIKSFILGEGSNLLLAPKIYGCVICIKLVGIDIQDPINDEVVVKVAAGESWHDTVCVLSSKNLNGLENLSFIPGSVGASPVQNIGAYGVEVSSLIESVEYFDPKTLLVNSINKDDCLFGYRDSIFKSGALSHVVILNVTFKLSTVFNPINSYSGLPEKITDSKSWIENIGAVRWSKLPNPDDIPNAGSFFKNPVVSKHSFLEIQKNHPGIVFFDQNEYVKIPAAWLIDQLGFKGVINEFGIGCYEKQALVLINSQKQGRDKILEKALEIQNKVKLHFNIELEIEPQKMG